jgi:hypothetical protein
MGGDATEELRMLAIRQRLDGIFRADVLIEAAVRAVLRDVESPSLVELAGLSRGEESQAQELFRAATRELSLAPPGEQEGRWALVHWWCQEIDQGRLRPEVGGRLIWEEGWNHLGYPDSLQHLVGWVSEWEDWSESFGVEREEYARRIRAEAQALLALPWPPS